jgi:pyruvate kinase
LVLAGVDVVRVNFSHGAHETHAAAIRTAREIEAELGRPIAVLADLQGPKLRLGRFAEGATPLIVGEGFRVDLDPAPGDARRVSIPHPEVFACLREGEPILLDDGRVRLNVLRVGTDFAETVVMAGDRLSDCKGVNLPAATIPVPALTAKDRRDLAFALQHGVDWVALSFVQTAADMAELRRLVDGRAAVLAKIEKPAALARIDEILDLCQGVMVARGDLGVELSPEDVPVVQKDLVRAARERGIPIIVATQMLESMISASTPTRAEANDVANAVYEGVDAVMLSAETAVGAHAVEAVAVMDRIIARVERDPRWPELMRAEHRVEESDALIVAAVRAAEASSAACIAAFTATGQTALRLARERSLIRMIALSPRLATARRLALSWGIETRVVPDIRDLEAMPTLAANEALKSGVAAPGQPLLVAAGVPMGSPGAVNHLRLVHAPKAGRAA